ncbi:3-phosphoshikimate 1-carboxyvinyltransferase [Roseospirillum parvum]|uniref:3-phosphoshikimate 1-carboxyvinyltransferase n=1 Tax=Roseospirillum parvum TaxID=83401 RepID=A0A1G7ZTH3_9PROT|nr:3-phosphoshikimate 1-carboxyvinyltransferase [Roseospirillum parvum]SDH11998.1 3-phosphoshikimate 1-carboxyvinyltransferase [Roseospirillum parvum]
MTAPSLSLVARRGGRLAGSIAVPGDKSISHRALMLGALAVGETRVSGLLEGEDVLRTAAAMRALGASVARAETAEGPLWTLHGRGVGGLREPDEVLDMGNAGTGARLLMGLLATHPLFAVLTGDASLRRRPMARVTEPLGRFGATFHGRAGGRLPIAVLGTGQALPVRYRLPVASAQVKSALLLAGLNTAGTTTVIEPVPTRDHSERMLTHFGAHLDAVSDDDGAPGIALAGQPELVGADVVVPGDPSSAAFPLVAGLLVPDSRLTVRGVGLNPRRTGLLATLAEMGADLEATNQRTEGGEPVADLTVTHGPLKGIDVPADRAPDMIDEYPILAVAAAGAEGTTRMRGLGELRVKESDRLGGTARGLAACGVAVEIEGDDLIVHGSGRPPAGGATIAVELDHRMAMAFLVLGLIADSPVAIDDGRAIDTSFPGFVDLMTGLGATISEVP